MESDAPLRYWALVPSADVAHAVSVTANSGIIIDTAVAETRRDAGAGPRERGPRSQKRAGLCLRVPSSVVLVASRVCLRLRSPLGSLGARAAGRSRRGPGTRGGLRDCAFRNLGDGVCQNAIG